MNLRQRHILQKTCQPVYRLPWKYAGPWNQTLDRWHSESLKESWEEALGIEPEANIIDVNLGFYLGLKRNSWKTKVIKLI